MILLEIRKYDSADLSQFSGLISELGYPTSVDEMEIRMKRIESISNYYTFVAVKNEILIGMIGITLHTTYTNNDVKVQITSLVTKEEYRGQGIAKLLIKHVEEWSLSIGSKFIYLLSGISEEREKAHMLYKSVGYDITGYRFVKRI